MFRFVGLCTGCNVQIPKLKNLILLIQYLMTNFVVSKRKNEIIAMQSLCVLDLVFKMFVLDHNLINICFRQAFEKCFLPLSLQLSVKESMYFLKLH